MGGSIYGGSGSRSSGGSIYSGSRPASSSSSKPTKKKSGGGLLGTLSRIPGAAAHDLADAAINSPGGIYTATRAGMHDVDRAFSFGPGASKKRRGKSWQTVPIAKAVGEQFKQDVQHPLRHPGNTGLDILGALSFGAGTIARGAAAGKAISEAGDVGRAAKAAAAASRFTKGVKPEARVIHYQGNEVVTGSYSKAASTRAAQKLLDKARHKFPDAPIVGRSLVSKAGRAIDQQRKIEEGLARNPARVLRAEGKSLSAGEQWAIRVQAEGTPIGERIAFEQKKLTNPKLSAKKRRTIQRNIKGLEEAKPYISEADVVGGQIKPVISDAKLAKLYADAKAVADSRTKLLTKNNLIDPLQAVGRETLPAEIIREALKRPGVNVAEFRVPYSVKSPKGAQDLIAGSGAGNMVGVAQKPGSITKSFEGKILQGTGGRNDVTTLIAESNIEAQRYVHLAHARQQIAEWAHDDPNAVPDKYRVAVNVGELNKIPQSVREILDKAVGDAKLSSEEVSALGQMYDSIRSAVFPNVKPGDLEATQGIKWVDRRLLGDLQKQNPLMGFNQHGAIRRGLNVFDQVNSAQKLAILYLKPAYLVPNLVGNAALALIQQGVFAPANLARAARLNAKLGTKTAHAVDELMGEGITGALHDPGFLKRINNFAAGKYGMVVDRPFRRSAFLHEARRQGYKSPAQIEKLIFDKSNRSDLIQVTQRANSELIDYSRLGPFEKNVIARAIFFYPWVKGSTVYTARFLGEHPITAAALGQLGLLGKAVQQKELGDLPSYNAGLIRVGGSDSLPRVINPTSATIFQTPADVAQSLFGVAGVGPGGTPTANLTPALAAAFTLLTGQNSLGFNPRNESNLHTAANSLYQGLPAFQLQKRLRGQQTSKSAHYSKEDALLKFLLGVTPYTVDRNKLNQKAGG